MNGGCIVPESIHFRTTGKIKFQCNFHYILPNAEPGPPHLQCAPLSKCLLTFDHADIIGSIADGQSDSISVLLHKLYYLGFLERGDSAANHSLTHAGKFQKIILDITFQGMGLGYLKKRKIHNRTREMSFGKQISYFSTDF